jgi:hypothetical protein
MDAALEAVRLRLVRIEMRRVSGVGLKEDVSPLNDVHCDWALGRTHEVP